MKNFLILVAVSLISVLGYSQNDSSLVVNNPVNISSPAFLGLDSGSISFYFKGDSSNFVSGNQYTIFTAEDATADNVFSIRIGNPEANTPNWGNGIGIFSKRTYIDTVLYRTSWSQVSANSLLDNEWHHFLATIDGGSVLLHIDGVYSPTGSESAMIPFAYPNVIFTEGNAFTSNVTTLEVGVADSYLDPNGGNQANAILPFDGQLDELILFSSPVSTTEYENIYDDGDNSFCTDGQGLSIAFHADFDDNSLVNSSDLSTDTPYATCVAPVAPPIPDLLVYPNPIPQGGSVTIGNNSDFRALMVVDQYGNNLTSLTTHYLNSDNEVVLNTGSIDEGIYLILTKDGDYGKRKKKIMIK